VTQDLAIKKVTHILVENIPQLPKLCFDPCAGHSALRDALMEAGLCVKDPYNCWKLGPPTDDISDEITDATTRDFWEYWVDSMCIMPNIDCRNWATVTYPPFDLASKILPLAYEHSPWGVAFLLKLDYLEPHGDWLIEHADSLRYIIAMNPRPRLRADICGTKYASVAWMVWQKSWSWKRLGIRYPFIFESEGKS
jgi:hypothetical protein